MKQRKFKCEFCGSQIPKDEREARIKGQEICQRCWYKEKNTDKRTNMMAWLDFNGTTTK